MSRGRRTQMQGLAPIAFVAEDGDIRINFGMFAGREATPAEIDELAHTLLEEVPDVTIVAEQTFVVDREMEASVHQIRVEPGSGDPRSLLARCAEWAETRISERHAEL
jgi:hypothetical protein